MCLACFMSIAWSTSSSDTVVVRNLVTQVVHAALLMRLCVEVRKSSGAMTAISLLFSLEENLNEYFVSESAVFGGSV